MTTTEPLYVRVPVELTDYVEEIKRELEINKADFISFLLLYARRTFTKDQIKELYNQLSVLGVSEIDQVA